MKEIKINVPDGKEAVWQETEDVKVVLAFVEQAPAVDNRPVTERIKTFADACHELGETHPFVETYNVFEHDVRASVGGEFLTDIAAYLKLRIICAALNEGRKPSFKKGEERWFPLHWLFSTDEINRMEVADKAKLIPVDEYQTGYAGIAFATSVSTPSLTSAYFGAHLCLNSEALAVYCGKQFAKLWADFYLIRK